MTVNIVTASHGNATVTETIDLVTDDVLYLNNVSVHILVLFVKFYNIEGFGATNNGCIIFT